MSLAALESLGAFFLSKGLDATLKQASWRRQLIKDISTTTKLPLSKWRLRRWLSDPSIQDWLVQGAEAYPNLLDSLTPEISRRRGAAEEAPEHAAELIDILLAQFLVALEPTMATAVASYRSNRRFDRLESLIEDALSSESWRAELQPLVDQLPFTTSGPMEALRQVSSANAARLIRCLVSPLVAPGTAVRSLVNEPPAWLDEAPPEAWIAIGRFSEAYLCLPEASASFQRAAELGAPDRAKWFALAGLYLVRSNPDGAQAFLARAESHRAGRHPVLELCKAAISEDIDAILQATTGDFSQLPNEDDGLLLVYRMTALRQVDRWTEAISLGRHLIGRFPRYAAPLIQVAEVLIAKAGTSPTSTKQRDLQEAKELALTARDLRRSWRGDSAAPAAIACQAAILLGSWAEALRIGLPSPRGQATAEEALAAPLRQLTLAAALGFHSYDLAEELAQSGTELQRLQVAAARLEQTDPQRAMDLYRQVLDLSEHPEDRFWALAGLAELGAWPLPEIEEIRESDEEKAEVLTAISEANRGLIGDAIVRLRRLVPDSPHASAMLAKAYESAGDVDAAAECLREAHRRYGDLEPLIAVAQLFGRQDRISEAIRQATDALAIAPMGAGKTLLHRLTVELANKQGDWPLMEAHARSLLEEAPEEPQAAWALAMALHNQGQLPDAWSVVADVDPRNRLEALLWIDLASSFGTGEAAILRVLQILGALPTDEQLSAAAIMAVHRIGPSEAVSAQTIARIQQATNEFFDRFPASRLLERISFESIEQLTAMLRQRLPVLGPSES